MKTRAFNVYLNRKHIDTVFYTLIGTKAEQEEEVRRSLIDHDGYDAAITVRREPKRKEA